MLLADPETGPFTTTLLHQAADPFRLLVASVKDYAIFMLDPDGRIVSWNSGAERIKGYAAAEVLGEPFARMYLPADAAGGKPRRDLDAALALGKCEEEGWRPRKDGTDIWVISTVTALHEADRHVGFAVVVRDITERKQTEDAARAGEQRLRLLIHGVKGHAIYTFDPAGLVTSWNAGAAAIYGYTAEEIVGQHRSQFYTPDEVVGGVHQSEQDEAAATGQFSEEAWRVRKDGSWFWANGTMTALFDPAGALTGFVKVVRDLSKQKQVEDVLRLRDRAIQAVSQGILIADPKQPDTPIIYASPGFATLTGYPVEDVIGRNCRFLQGAGTDPAAVALLRDAVRDGRECTVELLNYRRDGTPFWNALYITPVRDDRGRLDYFVGVLADVTRRRRLEQALQQSQKMEAVGRLAGGVAHDFNNLLTVIAGYCDMLVLAMPAADPHRGMVIEVRQAGERAAGLTRQLLAFSRKQVIEPVVLDLNDVVAQSEKMLRRLIGEDIVVAAVLDPNLSPVRADPGQVDQVLMNLCVNARDAMPTGGRLTIETRAVVLEDGQTAYPNLRPGRYAQLSVADTGEGMTDEVKAQIFEPFFTTKEEGKGTGLGLATVFGIVAQSNGHVGVYSELGLGTTFKILFPAVEAAPTRAAESRPSFPLRGTETVLLVEDEAGVRKVARIALQAQGYTVLEAAGGADAVLAADRHPGPIHLVVTDVVMPEMGGRQLADVLRSRHPGVRVLFMSGYTDDAVIRHGIIAHTDHFLQKPFTLLGLAKKARAVLDGPA
ncbi:MAG TPA: PAS domain-containing protein [Urbifossiella sp.]|nr:PAS domain-containing protein [Urbifossiella sp.]